MSDSSGGSMAAQSALDHGESNENGNSRGFFGRIFDAFQGNDDADSAEPEQARSVVSASGGGIAALRRIRVGDVAIPKPEIVAVGDDITCTDLIDTFRAEGFTRLPVYKGSLDSPVGLVHMKDLALNHGFGRTEAAFDLAGMMRPLLYVPPSMPIGVLLQKMQADRIHMALVIDEYGGVDGLVTLEDLIEQVIGEIEDEHDEDEGHLWVKEKPGQWLVQARAPLEDFEEETGARIADDEDSEEVDTLGGLVFMLTGRVPAKGEVVTGANGVTFEVVEADSRSIKRVRVRLADPATI